MQVGSLPQSLSRNDVQTTTQPGDIVLYSGNQLVIFFGSNSWKYTRLGHIEGLSTDEQTALLDKDIAVIEINTTKWQPCIKHDKKNSGANAIRNLQHKAFSHFWRFLASRSMPLRKTHFCTSQNRTIIFQTAKGHAKLRTGCTVLWIAEWCNPCSQTADTSRIRQALIFSHPFQSFLLENLCKTIPVRKVFTVPFEQSLWHYSSESNINLWRSEVKNIYSPSQTNRMDLCAI